MEEEVTLTSQEVLDIVHTALEGIAFIEDGHPLSPTWPMQMRDQLLVMLDRLYGTTGGA